MVDFSLVGKLTAWTPVNLPNFPLFEKLVCVLAGANVDPASSTLTCFTLSLTVFPSLLAWRRQHPSLPLAQLRLRRYAWLALRIAF